MKLNIRTKMLGGFLVVVGLLIVVFAIGWNGLNTLNSAADHIVHEQLPEDAAVRDLELQLAVAATAYPGGPVCDYRLLCKRGYYVGL